MMSFCGKEPVKSRGPAFLLHEATLWQIHKKSLYSHETVKNKPVIQCGWIAVGHCACTNLGLERGIQHLTAKGWDISCCIAMATVARKSSTQPGGFRQVVRQV